jgi:endonuclease/exonuclease/phosphatase (EEP) superfamily protein YafD
LLTAAAIVHAVVTFVSAISLRYAAEASVLTTIGLYAPRWPLGLPVPVLLVALARRRWRGLFGLELCAAFCWLFPLLGLRLGSSRAPTPEREQLRVLSFNIDSNARSPALLSTIRAANPDLIALEECGEEDAAFWKRKLPAYEWAVRDQFVLGSRYPISEVSPAFQQGAAYVRFRLELPRGPVHFYSLHPPSPGLTMSALLSQQVLDDPARLVQVRRRIAANTRDRERQLLVITEDARSSQLPVILAGDTNLPDPSPVLARTFAGFHDAFREVGHGFGYTFPTQGRPFGPWMRLDRVFVNDSFRVLEFTTLPPAESDHLPVLAVVEL